MTVTSFQSIGRNLASQNMSSLAFLVTELQVSCMLPQNDCIFNEIVFGERNEKETSRDTRGVCLYPYPNCHREELIMKPFPGSGEIFGYLTGFP